MSITAIDHDPGMIPWGGLHDATGPARSGSATPDGPAMTREARSGCARQFDRGMAGTSPS